MTAVRFPLEFPDDTAEFSRPAHRAGVELYRAAIVRHRFDPHAHDEFGLGAIEQGVERFRYGRAEHLAPAGSIVLMNPGEVHTGRAETRSGWRYRMIYIDADALHQICGESGWWFADAVVRGDALHAREFSAILEGLWHAEEPLAFDSLLFELVTIVRRYARSPRPAIEDKAMRFAPVIDYLRGGLAQRLTLDDLAAVAQLSPFHFLRRFHAQFGVTPQQMLMALRLGKAKQLLAVGESPAQVAAATGLADQAHLTRAFARRYAVTPGRYQRQLRR
jgi:AraC-like DNA-binding protein